MRHIAFYLGMAAALVASCSVQEDNFTAPEADGTRFHASFEQLTEEGTKAYVNEDLQIRWTADDLIGIFNKNTYNQQYKFLGKTGDNAGEFEKVEGAEFTTGNPITDVVAVYPYQAATITEAEVLSLVLPAEQVYAEHSFGLGANTMVSVTADNQLLFKNVGGYLRISLYGAGIKVSSITLQGNKGEKIAGKASVTMPMDGVPSVEMASDATTAITITCEEPVVLGATAAESVDFWFVVPPVEFTEGFTVSVTHEGGVFEKSTSKSIAITRNHLSKMAPVEVGAAASTSAVYRITNMWVWGGTGPEYKSTKVIDILAKPDYFNKEDGRGIEALKDNYYELRPDGTFVNHAGEDGRNWWFVYSGSVNPMDAKDVDVRQFYDVLPLSEGKYAISGSTVTFTKADNTTTTATFVGPGTYETTDPSKSVTISRQALKFTITGGKDVWTDPPIYTDYHAITGHPRELYIEMEQMPADFVIPEASKTTDADFEYIPPEDPNPGGEFDWLSLPGKWTVYGGNSAPYGIWVLGGSGTDPAFVCPIDKSWDWNDSVKSESDNNFTIKVTSFNATGASGTTTWEAGNDGQFWDYIWKKTGEDLSRFYNKIPKGENEFTADFASMTVTLGNGEKAKFLAPGTHEFVYGRTREIPAGCFGLWFHLMDPIPATADQWNDVDRFINAPLEYIIIFEKVK